MKFFVKNKVKYLTNFYKLLIFKSISSKYILSINM